MQSHRGRSSHNKKEVLCIAEMRDNIFAAYAGTISDKKSSKILSIILENVLNNTIIYTDEHKSYSKLSSLGYIRDIVCDKYEFVNSKTGTNTKAVKSFKNCLKLAIKKRKEVKTELRIFLNESIWSSIKKIWFANC